MTQDINPISLRIRTLTKQKINLLAKRSSDTSSHETYELIDNSLYSELNFMDDIFNALQINEVVRLRALNTREILDKLIKIFISFDTSAITFALKQIKENHMAMICIVQTKNVTLLMDQTEINMIRLERENEVKDFFINLDKYGIIKKINYIPELVEETKNDQPAAAINKIFSVSEPKPLNLKHFLGMFSFKGIYDINEFLYNPIG